MSFYKHSFVIKCRLCKIYLCFVCAFLKSVKLNQYILQQHVWHDLPICLVSKNSKTPPCWISLWRESLGQRDSGVNYKSHFLQKSDEQQQRAAGLHSAIFPWCRRISQLSDKKFIFHFSPSELCSHPSHTGNTFRTNNTGATSVGEKFSFRLNWSIFFHQWSLLMNCPIKQIFFFFHMKIVELADNRTHLCTSFTRFWLLWAKWQWLRNYEIIKDTSGSAVVSVSDSRVSTLYFQTDKVNLEATQDSFHPFVIPQYTQTESMVLLSPLRQPNHPLLLKSILSVFPLIH